MIKTYILSVLISVLTHGVVAANNSKEFFTPEFKTTEEILELAHSENSTNCASDIFARALYGNASQVSEADTETIVRAWAKNTMLDAPVLEQVLECPEIKSAPDDKNITFTPIVYEFPMGRTITINYSTTPKVLKQHLLLAQKRSLPNGEISPQLMNPNDPAKYLDTEPSWYGILVVQHDALSEFVGPGKNNTVSLKYIDDNIDDIYPRGYYCTSKSALANNSDTINRVVHEVVNLDDDSNDYYVAGDVNLGWIMYAEIAADIIITVVTWGGGTALSGYLKGQRSTNASRKIIQSMKDLSKIDDVKKYRNTVKQITQYSDDIAKLEKELKQLDKAEDILKHQEKIKQLTEALKNAERSADNMVKASKDVAKFKEQADIFREVWKYRQQLNALRRPQTGNIIVRNLKKLKGIGQSIKAANSGAKVLNKAGRVARAGMSSRAAKMADWLKDATLKHGARLAKVESKLGLAYGVISFIGDMYDHTSTTSKEFSNGIEFKPLCLLSADDLEGQENVVNYGMWLMWTGNSSDAADDDAAYLQAMDFATKFYYQLDEYQDEHGAQCNVDIYVVHPIIRLDETNIDNPKGEMFYLFMNDIPWTTAEQFDTQILDVKNWENAQQTLHKIDPINKYKRTQPNENDAPVAFAQE